MLSVCVCVKQQAFNATAVVRHMRRLQLGSSMGASMDGAHPNSGAQSRGHAAKQQTPLPNQPLNSALNLSQNQKPAPNQNQNQNQYHINNMSKESPTITRKDCK